MATVWPVGTFIDNLKTNITTRLGTEGYSSVEVWTGPPEPDQMDDDMEAVILGIAIDTEEESAALGGAPQRNEERNVIECAVAAWDIVGEDGPEAAIKGARDRALGIFAVVETELRSNVKQGLTETVRFIRISRKAMDQGVQPDKGRFCLIEFDITLAVRTDVG